MATVLITGASSGIGYAFAEIFASHGYDLVLVARREKELHALKKKCEEMHHIHIHVVAKDLAKSSAPQEIFDWLKKENIQIDILINNAGFGEYGPFFETAWEKEATMIQVNVVALTALTKFIGQEMVKRNSGTILNVASVASFLPGPLMGVYYATKAYVLSFSESLATDLAKTNVRVIALCPGMTKSGFQDAAGLANEWQGKNMQTSEEVAAYGFRCILKGKPIIAIPSFKNKMLARLGWLLPRSLVAFLVRKMQEKR